MQEIKGMQAYYKPDRTAKVFWQGRLENEYPVEVLKMSNGRLSKAVIRTRKDVVMAVPKYCVVFKKSVVRGQ